MASRRFDLDQLDDTDPFEIDTQTTHLFKHASLGVHDVYEVWSSDPLFYPALPPAHWLMVAEVAGQVLVARWPPPKTAIPDVAARSAATRPPGISPTSTGGTDDRPQEDDARRSA